MTSPDKQQIVVSKALSCHLAKFFAKVFLIQPSLLEDNLIDGETSETSILYISWWTTRTGQFPTAHQTISNLWPPGPTRVSQAARLSPLFRPLPDTDLSRGRHQFHSESHRGRTPKAIGGSELGSSVEREHMLPVGNLRPLVRKSVTLIFCWSLHLGSR